MKAWSTGFTFACSLACSITHGQSNEMNSRLETIAGSYTPGNNFMGTVLVAEGDHTLLDRGYGMANLEWNIPNAPAVKFRVASLTKQFTATLILLLQEDGKLQIDDPVAKYLPNTPKTWEKITLANLLNHTSGIPNFARDKEYRTWKMTSHTTAEEIAFFRDKPLEFEPGSKFDYSNSNYEVLGAVIEQVGGKSYGDQLRERIFEPLGMHDSGLDGDELVLSKRAQGYIPGKNGLAPARPGSMSVFWAAGGIYSTTEDLLLWERGLFGGKILNEASLKSMTTPGKGNYGMGVDVSQMDGKTVITHGGDLEGFNTYLSYVPARKITVVVLSNVNGAAPDSMGSQLLSVALGKPVILASERKAVPIQIQDLQKFVGVYDLAPIPLTLTVAGSGTSITSKITNQPAMEMMYQGEQGGHFYFYLPKADGEVEFISDATGAIQSLVLHLSGDHLAKRLPTPQ